MSQDYYQILNIERDASAVEIKKAFQKLAKQYHPDINKASDAEAKFKEVNEAFQVLSDPTKRAQYDQFGSVGGASSSGRGGFDFFDIFDFMSGGRQSQSSRGADVRVDISVSLEQAFKGVEKTVEVKMKVKCQVCDGLGAIKGNYSSCGFCKGKGEVKRVVRTPFGQFMNVNPCPKCGGKGIIINQACSACHGSGSVMQLKKIKFKVPAGVSDGQVLKLGGEGEPGLSGNGDVFVVINVLDHELFERDGSNLYCKIKIDLVTAILGGKIEVPTIDGSASIKIPKGTQSNSIFRLRNQGMPRVNNFGRGDQLVKVEVVIPKKLSHEQTRLIKEFGSVEPEIKKGFFERVKERIV